MLLNVLALFHCSKWVIVDSFAFLHTPDSMKAISCVRLTRTMHFFYLKTNFLLSTSWGHCILLLSSAYHITHNNSSEYSINHTTTKNIFPVLRLQAFPIGMLMVVMMTMTTLLDNQPPPMMLRTQSEHLHGIINSVRSYAAKSGAHCTDIQWFLSTSILQEIPTRIFIKIQLMPLANCCWYSTRTTSLHTQSEHWLQNWLSIAPSAGNGQHMQMGATMPAANTWHNGTMPCLTVAKPQPRLLAQTSNMANTNHDHSPLQTLEAACKQLSWWLSMSIPMPKCPSPLQPSNNQHLLTALTSWMALPPLQMQASPIH